MKDVGVVDVDGEFWLGEISEWGFWWDMFVDEMYLGWTKCIWVMWVLDRGSWVVIWYIGVMDVCTCEYLLGPMWSIGVICDIMSWYCYYGLIYCDECDTFMWHDVLMWSDIMSWYIVIYCVYWDGYVSRVMWGLYICGICYWVMWVGTCLHSGLSWCWVELGWCWV